MRDDEDEFFEDQAEDEAEPEVEETEPEVKKKPKARRATQTAKLDEFGLRLSSVRSRAAALYAREEGATLAEVKDQVGSVQFNILTQLKKKGFTVTERKEAGANNRTVTRYFLQPKE